jgi:hypothetical protein
LGLAQTEAVHAGREVLMSLSLDRLQEPALLSRSDVALRVPTLAEALGPLLEWRIMTGFNAQARGIAQSWSQPG